MNDLKQYSGVFDGIQPWGGDVPVGYRADFLGTLTDLSFEEAWGVDPKAAGGGFTQTAPPVPGLSDDQNGEFWFEAADWVLAANDARGSYVMVTLGACFGYQAVGAYRALQQLNPMPCRLVAIDAIPENIEWTRRQPSRPMTAC